MCSSSGKSWFHRSTLLFSDISTFLLSDSLKVYVNFFLSSRSTESLIDSTAHTPSNCSTLLIYYMASSPANSSWWNTLISSAQSLLLYPANS